MSQVHYQLGYAARLIFKGHNSLKNVGRVMVLNLCTSSYDALYLIYICTKFHENILAGIQVIEQTQFS